MEPTGYMVIINVYNNRGEDITQMIFLSPVDDFNMDIIYRNEIIGRITGVPRTEETEEKIEIEIEEGFSFTKENHQVH